MHRHLVLALCLKEEAAEEQCASQLVDNLKCPEGVRVSHSFHPLACSPAPSLAELHVPVGLVKPQMMMPEL